MIAVFDPDNETVEIIEGFSPVSGLAAAGRALYAAATDRIWVVTEIGNPHRFAIIDPSDNSMTMLDDTSIAGPSDIAQTSTHLWISGTNTSSSPFRPWVSKVNTSTLAVTDILSEAILEAWLGLAVTNFSVGAIECVTSISEVWIVVNFNQGFGTEGFILSIDESTGAIIDYVSPSPGTFKTPSAYMHYSPEFDRVILSNSTSGHLRSCNPADLSETIVSTDDGMSATKGCFCTSINKVALPVLTGAPGSRHYTVNFYSAADLGA
jgi:hypothetical protein